MTYNHLNRDERFFFMPDEPPAAGPNEPTAPPETRSKTDPPTESVTERLLKKAQTELAAATAELQAVKDAELSEVDRLKKQTVELEIRVKASELDALRRKVAHEENVPLEALEYLSGGDEDGLRGSARKLVTLIGSKNVSAGSRTQPAAGQAPSLDEQILAAEKSGNRTLSISLKNQKMRAS
jgi:hypothetical protein